MKYILYPLMLMLSASAFPAPNPAPVSYVAGAFAFEESSGAAEAEFDELRVRAKAGKPISLRFSRSRGVADVVELTAQGNLRLGGQRILRPDGQVMLAKQGLWALSEDVSVGASWSQLTINSQGRRCRSTAPAGFRFEQLTAGQLPRSMAANDNYLFAILEGTPEAGQPQILLPFRVSLTTCQSAVGTKFASPGFDYRLQVRGERALLASRAESALLLSNDGLAWKREDLPAATHMLLATDISASSYQVAVSRADKDFALGFFSKTESNGGVWQDDSEIQAKPMTWIDGAREVAIAATLAR